jgi:hypothetical protein
MMKERLLLLLLLLLLEEEEEQEMWLLVCKRTRSKQIQEKRGKVIIWRRKESSYEGRSKHRKERRPGGISVSATYIQSDKGVEISKK